MSETKLILQMRMSLDGFACGPNGEGEWMFPYFGPQGTAWVVESLGQAGIHIMGSTSFQNMSGFWPTSTAPTAGAMNAIPKAVFSKRAPGEFVTEAGATEAAGSWGNPRVMGGDLKEDIAQLKREYGKPVFAHGGARFAQSLIQSRLVDEYSLVILPIVLGKGLRLFPETEAAIKLALVDTKVFPTGTVAQTYRPV